MEIKKILVGNELTIALTEKLDTTSAPELEEELGKSLEGVTKLIFDFAELSYLSSAGLRVLLNTQKLMSKKGEMIIRHCNDVVMDIFDMTGFSTILTIEN